MSIQLTPQLQQAVNTHSKGVNQFNSSWIIGLIPFFCLPWEVLRMLRPLELAE